MNILSENTEAAGMRVSEDVKASKPKQEKDEVQITISLECERKLHERVAQINEGFELTRVTRKHLAIYVIEGALAQFTEEDVQAVRQSTLTDLTLLEKAFREAKASGVVPQELRDYLWKSLDLTQSPKRTKKSRQSKYSKDIHMNEGAE